MDAPPIWVERILRTALLKSARHFPAARRVEVADAAWAACVAARHRGGLPAFARAMLSEILDLRTVRLRQRAGAGPRISAAGRPARSPRSLPMTITDDVRRAARRLRSHPGSLVLSAGMLAIGIGVTTAMFTVLDALMLNPVPFRDAGHLTAVMIGDGNRVRVNGSTAPQFRGWRASQGFERVEAAQQSGVTFETPGGLVTKGGAHVSPGLFDMLGVRPVIGRTFSPGDGAPGADDRLVISEEIWTTLYDRDPGIIGRRVRVSGVPAEIIGVMPAGFRFPYANTQTWLPVDFDAPPATLRRVSPQVFARLRSDMPQSDVLRLADEALNASVTLEPNWRTVFRPIAAGMVDPYSRRAVTALSVGVALVFLVLCANAMNVLLTRLAARGREFGVCAALGASRARLLREAIAETLFIAAVAAAAGLAIAAGLVQLARGYLPDAFLARTLTPVAISGRAVVATSLLGLIAAAIAGLTPAWLATKVDAAGALRAGGRGGTDGRAQRRLARGLLVAEVALAAALLAGGAQLLRTFVNLTREDRGLNAAGVITAWVSLPEFAFKDRPGRLAFAAALEDRLRSLPGAAQVALSSGLPPRSATMFFGPLRSDAGVTVDTETYLYNVGPRFFELFGIRLLAGRPFQEPSQPDEVIVGARLAAQLWPGEAATGRTFTMSETTYRVGGVAQEIRNPSLDPRTDRAELYFPLVVERQGRVEAAAFGSGQIFAAMRCGTSCPPLDVISAAIRSISAQAVIASLGPMEEEYLKDLARPRAAAALAAAFAMVALLASAGGLFGVLNAAVARRRREFGIRVALGMEPRHLTQLVLRDALALAAAGLALGVFGAWMLSRSLTSLTYNVSPADPLSWLTVCGSLAAAVLLASWRPAVQAARVAPSELLRAE